MTSLNILNATKSKTYHIFIKMTHGKYTIKHTIEAIAATFFEENREKLFPFIFSFLVTASLWKSHDELFQEVENINMSAMRMNFLWILVVVFIPVSTNVFTQAEEEDAGR